MKTTTAALLLTAALSLIAVQAKARLGESSAQLIARFGQPVSKRGDDVMFSKNGITIIASGWEGVCCQITYRAQGLFNDAQIKSFLESNDPGGQRWIPEPTLRLEEASVWNSPDKRYRAVYTGNSMSFSNFTLIWARQAARDKAQAAATAGF